MQHAYYARNNSYSRSYNAEQAESQGRLPKTRAASYLGMNARAFDAGCRAMCYIVREWHHVGKYASRVKYYDTNIIRKDPRFWDGAAETYKSYAKKRELMERKAVHCG